MKKFRLGIIHIGLEKTGTTTIQEFLAVNREGLKAQGFYYSKEAGDSGSQWGFVASVMDEPWISDVGYNFRVRNCDDQVKFRQELTEKLNREFNELSDCGMLIISSEHFHSRLTTKESILRLREYLSSWIDDFVVIMYLRRQDQVALSWYSTKVKCGEKDEMLNVSLGGDYHNSYEKIFNNWSEVFGLSSVKVRLFNKAELCGGDLLADFCKICNIDIGPLKVPKSSNLSLNQSGIDFMSEVGRHTQGYISGERNPIFWKISSVVSQLCQGNACLITRKEARQFHDRFRTGNEEVKQKAFPERVTPLFDDDFSMYPEHIPAHTPVYSEAVRLAVALVDKISEEHEQRIKSCEFKLTEAKTSAAGQEQRAIASEARADKLQNNLDALHAANHHHQQLAEASEQQIQSIYQSHSWRITAPLRWCANQARLLRQYGLALRLKALLKRII